jgi:DNA polymerase delta subunit 1
MSPTKRALSSLYGEVDNPKRIRGGGFDDDEPPDETALFDEDPVDDEENIEMDQEPYEEIHEEALEEVKAKIPVKDQQRWKRPDLSEDLNCGQNLDMQWIDMDVVISSRPLEKNPNTARDVVLGTSEGQVAVLRCYGVTEQGHSIAAFLHGFTPYAYFALPTDVAATALELSDADLGGIRSRIDGRLREVARGVNANTPALVLGIEHISDCQSIFGYENPHTQFLKVYVALPGLLAALKRVMEEGIHIPELSPNSNEAECYAPFECNVPFVLRFMVDRGITGAGWLTFPANTYSIRPESGKETHCQVCGGNGSFAIAVVERAFHLTRRVHFPCRLKLTYLTTMWYHENRKENGTRLRHFAYCRSILNVKGGKVTFPRRSKIP